MTIFPHPFSPGCSPPRPSFLQSAVHRFFRARFLAVCHFRFFCTRFPAGCSPPHPSSLQSAVHGFSAPVFLRSATFGFLRPFSRGLQSSAPVFLRSAVHGFSAPVFSRSATFGFSAPVFSRVAVLRTRLSCSLPFTVFPRPFSRGLSALGFPALFFSRFSAPDTAAPQIAVSDR